MSETVFINQVPSIPNASDNGTNYELGMKFQSAKPGQITAIRYWKAASETGTHVGRIWSSSGAVLGTCTFTNETASGWQQQALSTPVNILANTTYVVSANINSFFADSHDGLASSVVNGNLSSVADGNNGVYGSPGSLPTNSYQNSNYFYDVVFVASINQPTETVFTTQVPSSTNASDSGNKYELGMKLQSGKAGQITAIRYWKADSETGTHVGTIWSSSGAALATVTFSNETASGWQQQALSTPLNIQANTTYLVSVNTNGYFVATNNGLASSVVNGDLYSVADGNNGVLGSPGSFPTNSYQNTNYFRDIVFAKSIIPTITKVSGDNQSGTAGNALPNPLVVQVKDSAGNPQAGTTVSFALATGGGSVSPTSAVTNANGQVSTVLTPGTKAVTNTVRATASGVGTVSFTATAQPTPTNPIYVENQKTGTTAWKITNQASTQIAGYAGATSVNRGGSLPIKVSLAQPGQYTIEVYRLGYYGGTGARLLFSSGSLNGVTQPECAITDASTRLVECNWSTSYTLAVGSDWTSGVYIAKLTDQTTGTQSQVWFVVRDDGSTSDVLFQSSFTSFMAYNNTGGYSLYPFNSINGQNAFKVSLDRPFSETTTQTSEYNNLLRWERNMVRWMESQGYDISYVTNLDVHTNPKLLRQHKVFLSVGHDEYWSMEQRNGVEQARDAGVNLGFFSANSAYWRVRFENSSTGVPNRVMACYKDAWAQDPVAPTNKFRSPQNNRPENALLGIMYTGDRDQLYSNTGSSNPTYGGYDFVVTNSTDPYYANTNLHDGDTLSILVGFEWDAIVNNGFTPSGLVVLSQSPVNPSNLDTDLPSGTNTQISNAVRYTAAGGGKVFSTGSVQWLWGLDSDGVNPPRQDVRAQQFAVNVLADLGAKPIAPASNLVVP